MNYIISKLKNALERNIIDDDDLDYYKDNYIQVQITRKSNWTIQEGYIVQYNDQFILFYDYHHHTLSIDGLKLIRRADCIRLYPSWGEDSSLMHYLIIECLREHDLFRFITDHRDFERTSSILDVLTYFKNNNKYVDIYVENVTDPYIFCKIHEIKGNYIILHANIVEDTIEYLVDIDEITMIHWNRIYHSILAGGIERYMSYMIEGGDENGESEDDYMDPSEDYDDAESESDSDSNDCDFVITVKNKAYDPILFKENDN